MIIIKHICLEHQQIATHTALLQHLTLWPEYNGLVKDDFEVHYGDVLDEATDEAWGKLLEASLNDFAQQHSLVWVAYELPPPGCLSLVLPHVQRWRKRFPYELHASYINMRQHSSHEQIIFVACTKQQAMQLPPAIAATTFSYDLLLLTGTLMVQLGIEEAAAELWMAQAPDVLLQLLEQHAAYADHAWRTDTSFTSHWLTANPFLSAE